MTLRDDVLNLAKGQVGYREGYNNNEKYAAQVPGLEWANHQPWCAVFVSWCAYKAGAGKLYPMTAGCYEGTQWFKNRGQFSTYPSVGAQVFFGPSGGSHTGLVYKYDDTYIYTVEGNTNDDGSAEGNGVYYKVRARRSSYVYGYGHPKFPTTPPPPPPAPKPVVDLSNVVDAAHRDPKAAQGVSSHPADVRRVEAALQAEGLLNPKYALDGCYGTATIEAYKAWQRKLGYSGSDADGYPGMTSLTKLGAKHGFTVKA